ncbi:MAG: hypothetical protein Q7R73_02045 [bacterium]|nr:hypothetical protein [bacterium]
MSEEHKSEYHAGITLCLNPLLLIEMKLVEKKWSQTLIVHTTFLTHHISTQWIKEYRGLPVPAITFTDAVVWVKNPNSSASTHRFQCSKKNPRDSTRIEDIIEPHYSEIERILHEDGTVLWQKKR